MAITSPDKQPISPAGQLALFVYFESKSPGQDKGWTLPYTKVIFEKGLLSVQAKDVTLGPLLDQISQKGSIGVSVSDSLKTF